MTEGAAHFGSGWVWLVADRARRPSVIATHDANDIVTQADTTPLLVCDLWEHAYYLDYQNDRKSFLETWFDALPNWRLAESQYAAAREGGQPWKTSRTGARAGVVRLRRPLAASGISGPAPDWD